MVPSRRRARPALLAAAVALLAACGPAATESAAPAPAPALPAGAAAAGGPAFTATTLAGEPFDSAARFAERPTVLWFWAPWCTVCRAEAPEVRAVAEELAGEVAVVGVAGRGEPAAMADFVADTGLGGVEHVVDTDGSIWSAYGVVAQPAFAFVERDGGAEVFNGALPPDDLRAAARALAER